MVIAGAAVAISIGSLVKIPAITSARKKTTRKPVTAITVATLIERLITWSDRSGRLAP